MRPRCETTAVVSHGTTVPNCGFLATASTCTYLGDDAIYPVSLTVAGHEWLGNGVMIIRYTISLDFKIYLMFCDCSHIH